MSKRLTVALLPVMMIAVLLSACEMPGFLTGLLGGEKRTEWSDPAGDAPDRNYPQKDGSMLKIPALDIVSVTAEGKDGALHATFKIKDTFDKFFSYTDNAGKIHNMTMVELYIDLDNSTGTGGAPEASGDSARPLEGYDVAIAAMPSLQYKEKDGSISAISGNTFIDTNEQEMTGYYATYFIRAVSPADKGMELNEKEWHRNKKHFSSASGDTLEIRVPYEWLGLKAEDTIRLCYREMGQGAGTARSISEDKRLELQ